MARRFRRSHCWPVVYRLPPFMAWRLSLGQVVGVCTNVYESIWGCKHVAEEGELQVIIRTNDPSLRAGPSALSPLAYPRLRGFRLSLRSSNEIRGMTVENTGGHGKDRWFPDGFEPKVPVASTTTSDGRGAA